MKVFWSWQDDSPGKTNRHFIKDALEQAIIAVEGEFEFEDADRPALDHDTKGVAGAAEIVPTVMAKIAESAVFIADVTPIAETDGGTALPNPNVMVELGWSLNKPGAGRQVYVLNTADGWTVEGLPFDIRHRRVLTYNLAATADAKTRDRVKKVLVAALADAIRTNLNQHLEDKAAATPIAGVAANADDASLWAGAEAGFAHQDSFGRAHWTPVTIPAGARSYIRIVPGGWTSGPPDVATIGKLDISVAPQAPTFATGGDFGPTKEGYVRYWISSRGDEARESEDLVMYFEDTGEFWLVNGGVVAVGHDKTRHLDLAMAMRGWSGALRRANWIMDRFGAYTARRVEVGLADMEGVRFPGGWESARVPARRPALSYDETRRDWSTPEAQQGFLGDALGKVFGLFGLDKLKPDETAKFLKANDAERGREPPWA